MKCPGQDSRYWKNDSIFEVKCPKCGSFVEFFKDDTARKCPKCEHRFANPNMDFGCASYCKYAEQCIGSLPNEVLEKKDNLLKDRVALDMKKYFQSDFKRIGHASKVARYAEKIAQIEGGDMAVIIIASYLHDIGIHEAERKYESTAPKYQEKEGPPIAKQILLNLSANQELIEEVCDIVGHHHHPRKEESINFKVVYDADRIVNIEDKQKEKALNINTIKKIIEKSFLTETGKKLAEDIFIKGEKK
ncbi:MAG: HD domain-containing protein [Desulfobacterales bacterium]|nr:HD domain-containing protein [Desulfobacterales bacterium]